MRCLFCGSVLLRQSAAKPPHANSQNRRHHRDDTAQRHGGKNAEHNESAYREYTDDNDEQIGNRIADGKMPVRCMTNQLLLANLLFDVGLSIEAFEPRCPDFAFFIILLEKLANSTVW